MSWKCDKCHRKFSDDEKPVEVQGFKFCAPCISGESAEAVKENREKNKKIGKILMIVAAVIIAASIAAGIVVFKKMITVAIVIWVVGLLLTMVLMAIGERFAKKK